jgi:hypothetical protein
MNNGQKALSPWKRLEGIVRRAIFKGIPGLGLYDSPRYARVLKARFGGGSVDGRSKGFSADVEVLTRDLLADPAWVQITDVPIDPQTFGEGGAVYTVPRVGAIVRLGFMYHDPAFPFIMSITAEGSKLPEGKADEFRVEIGDIAFQITKDTLKFRTKKYNTDIEELINKLLEHTHLSTGPGSPTSPTSGSVPPGLTLPTDFKQGGL